MEWKTGNYDVTTTSALEWWFVVDPDGTEATKVRDARADKKWPAEEKLRSNPDEAQRSHMRQPKRADVFRGKRDEVDHQLAELGQPRVQDSEFYGGRLYTGPLFEKYNAVLRAMPNLVPFFVNSYMKLCMGNRYVGTLHAINRLLLKLGKIKSAVKLYRGISGMRLPDKFFHEDEHGLRGGIEFGFMSATSDQSVAMTYASNKDPSLVYEIDQGMLDRGASLQWFSQCTPRPPPLCPAPMS